MTTIDTKDFLPETWIYLGVRLGKDNKTFYTYQDGKGETRWYARPIAGRMVGGEYQVRCKRADGDVSVLRDASNYIGVHHDKALIDASIVADQAAKAKKEVIALEKKDLRERNLDTMTLRDLAREYRKLMPSRRRALMCVILDKLAGGSHES